MKRKEASDQDMIRYTDSLAGIRPENLQGFFVGWPNPPSPEMHFRLLAGSDEIVLAVDEQTGNAVGFITAITDGVLSAYIPFLEVLPEYQGRRVGHELVRRMLEKLGGLYMVDIVCDAELEAFYAGFGMMRSSAMILRRHQHQSGREKT